MKKLPDPSENNLRSATLKKRAESMRFCSVFLLGKLVLAALVKAAKMTHHTALFKADRLPTIRTGLSKQAILMFMMSFVVFVI